MQAAAGIEPEEYLYKVLVVGEAGTGKTSIIKRYVHNMFSNHYKATIGVDFALKVLHWNNGRTIIRLQLWDIAGQERFGNMTRVYYREAVGAFVVFDVTRPMTFEVVSKWKKDIDSKVMLSDGRPIPVVLLGNKADLNKDTSILTGAQLDQYCKDNGFAGWFETSAKEDRNVQEAAKCLVKKILEDDQQRTETIGAKQHKDTVSLTAANAENPASGGDCKC